MIFLTAISNCIFENPTLSIGIGGLLLSVITFWLTKNKEIRTKLKYEKLDAYKRLVSSISAMVVDKENNLYDFSESVNTITILSSFEVNNNLNKYVNKLINNTATDKDFNNLIVSIRKDIGLTTTKGKFEFKLIKPNKNNKLVIVKISKKEKAAKINDDIRDNELNISNSKYEDIERKAILFIHNKKYPSDNILIESKINLGGIKIIPDGFINRKDETIFIEVKISQRQNPNIELISKAIITYLERISKYYIATKKPVKLEFILVADSNERKKDYLEKIIRKKIGETKIPIEFNILSYEELKVRT